jgi:glycine/serine hydroxymethyltransferase
MYNFNGISLPNDEGNSQNGQRGLRFGTNVITARGYQTQDCKEVAEFLHEMALIGRSVDSHSSALPVAISIKQLSDEVEKFAVKFPLPGVTSQQIF